MYLLRKVKNIYSSYLRSIISAFVDNVATVLMIAPIALEICKKLKANPGPLFDRYRGLLAIGLHISIFGLFTVFN